MVLEPVAPVTSLATLWCMKTWKRIWQTCTRKVEHWSLPAATWQMIPLFLPWQRPYQVIQKKNIYKVVAAVLCSPDTPGWVRVKLRDWLTGKLGRAWVLHFCGAWVVHWHGWVGKLGRVWVVHSIGGGDVGWCCMCIQHPCMAQLARQPISQFNTHPTWGIRTA